MFRTLCRLADRFRACPDDPEAAKIGSVLSLLALYATQPKDQDFRYDLGSTLMDLALDQEASAGDGGAVDNAEPSRGERADARVVPYARARALP